MVLINRETAVRGNGIGHDHDDDGDGDSGSGRGCGFGTRSTNSLQRALMGYRGKWKNIGVLSLKQVVTKGLTLRSEAGTAKAVVAIRRARRSLTTMMNVRTKAAEESDLF